MAMEAQPEDRGVTVMERVRAVHRRMVDAVLGGDGLEGVATLAAGETGGVVAIVVPRLGAAAASVWWGWPRWPGGRPAAWGRSSFGAWARRPLPHRWPSCPR